MWERFLVSQILVQAISVELFSHLLWKVPRSLSHPFNKFRYEHSIILIVALQLTRRIKRFHEKGSSLLVIKSILVDMQDKIMQAAVSWCPGNVGWFNFSHMVGNIFACLWSDSVLIPKRERHDGQRQIMGAKACIGKFTTLRVMLRAACVCKRDVPCQNSLLATLAWRQLTRPDWCSRSVTFWLAQVERGRSDWPGRG